MKSRRSISWVVLFGLCAVISCAGGGTAKKTEEPANVRDDRPQNRESGDGLWDQLQRARAEKDKRIANQQKLDERNASERARVPAEIREKLERWWKNFVNADPTWIDDRRQWKKEGPQAANLLVENLITLMVGAFDVTNGVMYQRAKTELVEWAEYSIPYLVSGIARSKADDVVVQHCVETLGLIGAPAVAEISRVYAADDEFRGRFNLLRALARIADPAGVPFLIGVVESGDDYRLRFTAVEALGKSKDARAVPVLVKSLEDDDISVRKFSAGYLGSFNDRKTVAPLIRAMRAAEDRRTKDPVEGEIAQMCRRSLEFITKQKFQTASQWDAWWQVNKG